MEKLEKGKQAEIRKMTDARLIDKLTKAGISIEEVEHMDRASLLDRWAEVVIAGKEVASKPSVAGVTGGYDLEFERQKFLIQMKQWKEEKKERETQREAEERRWEVERKEREIQREIEKEAIGRLIRDAGKNSLRCSSFRSR